jgi:hypothetical protein
MIDRLVHHAEILSLKGDSYRLWDKDLGRSRTRLNSGYLMARCVCSAREGGPFFNRRKWPTFQPALTPAAG